jgi:hypothetical protein
MAGCSKESEMAGWRSKGFRDGWLAGVLRGSEMAGWRSIGFRDGWPP